MIYVISNKKHFAVLDPYFVNLFLENDLDRNCLIFLKIHIAFLELLNIVMK
jgi:hypothetical protein